MTKNIRYSQFYKMDARVLTDILNPSVIPTDHIYIHRGYVRNKQIPNKFEDVIIAATNRDSPWGFNVAIYVWDRREWITEHAIVKDERFIATVKKYLWESKRVIIVK